MLDFTEMPPGSFLGADGVVRSWLQPIWWSPGALLKVRANPKFLTDCVSDGGFHAGSLEFSRGKTDHVHHPASIESACRG